MLHTIVVPLDGSRFSEQALIPAYRIARRLHATVELVHVFEPTLPSIYASGAPVLEPRLDRDLRAEARAYLEMIAARERRSADVRVAATLLEGPVVKALADHVARLDGALVVMTTHGRGGLARAWLGSVTDGLVRDIRQIRDLRYPVFHGGIGPLDSKGRGKVVAIDVPVECGGVLVHPGDLVFFDHTWDYNGDGRVNDPLTHVGIVEQVESDGTIVFISRVSDAIERYRMNLAQPHVHRRADGRVLNDYMRRKRWSDQKGTRYLTGELFAAFGTRVAS